MSFQWMKWKAAARPVLEYLGLPDTQENIELIIPELCTEILMEIHQELQKFGLSLHRYNRDIYAEGFAARADVHGPKSVVFTKPAVMSDDSYRIKWIEATASLRDLMREKGIEISIR